MKILKRTSNVYNLILFQVFSFIFLHVVLSLKTGHSALNIERIYELASSYTLLIALLVINSISIFFVKKISYFQIIFTSMFIGLTCFYQFFESFDKTILFYFLFYVFTSFFFTMIWKLELEESVYNPNFDNRELRKSGLQKVSVSLTDSAGQEISGVIQNWSKGSFFLSTIDTQLNVRDSLLATMSYQGLTFEFKAKVATHSRDGFGLYVVNEQNTSSLNWIDFYDIISDRGIYPINV